MQWIAEVGAAGGIWTLNKVDGEFGGRREETVIQNRPRSLLIACGA